MFASSWSFLLSFDSFSCVFSPGGLRWPRGEQHRWWHLSNNHREAAEHFPRLRCWLWHQFEIFFNITGRQPLLFQQTGPLSPSKSSGQPQLSEGNRHLILYSSETHTHTITGIMHIHSSHFYCVIWQQIIFLPQEVEAKYNSLIQQRPERSAADTDGNKGTALHAQRWRMNNWFLIYESLPVSVPFLIPDLALSPSLSLPQIRDSGSLCSSFWLWSQRGSTDL